MNSVELNVAMVRKNINAKTLAEAIKKSHVSFNKKRCGDVPFNVNEIKAIADVLELNLQQVNVIFFGSQLPNGK